MPFPKDSPLHRIYPDGFGKEGLSLEGRLEWMLTAMYQNIPDAHPGILGPSDNEGADVLKQSVGEATGLKLDYYLQVNLQGFPEIVDAIGGITVNVNERVAMGGISSSHIPPAEWIEPRAEPAPGRPARALVRPRPVRRRRRPAADPPAVRDQGHRRRGGPADAGDEVPGDRQGRSAPAAHRHPAGAPARAGRARPQGEVGDRLQRHPRRVEAAAEVPAPRLRRPARHRREGARSRPGAGRTPTTPPTPSKSTRKPVAPPPTPAGPTQNLVDACAYQPNGDQPN